MRADALTLTALTAAPLGIWLRAFMRALGTLPRPAALCRNFLVTHLRAVDRNSSAVRRASRRARGSGMLGLRLNARMDRREAFDAVRAEPLSVRARVSAGGRRRGACEHCES